ncbi:MAG TPA: hypothetical protein VJ385_15925 [Fibrobacteria bacterium]|nr:hypothetical protein [Fibrobacteria bacterium]
MKGFLNPLALVLCAGLAAGSAEDLKLYWYFSTIDTNAAIWGSSRVEFDKRDSIKVAYRGYEHDIRFAEFTPWRWRSVQADTNYTGGPAQMNATLASNGQPHIIYQSADYQRAYHATFSGGKWQHRLLGNIGIENLDWYQMAIAPDSKGGVHMVYGKDAGGDATVMYHAYIDSAGTLSDTGFASKERSGKWCSITVDSKDSPVIAHLRITEERLAVAYIDSGAWKTQTIGEDLPQIPMGFHASILRESDTLYRILYQDRSRKELWMASGKPGGTWTTEKIDNLDGYTNFTALNDIGMGKDGTLFVAYTNITSPDGETVDKCKLMFAYRRDGAWQKQVVDSSGKAGEFVSMAIDSKGQPAITYYDRGTHHLKLALGSFTELTGIKPAGKSLSRSVLHSGAPSFDATGRLRSTVTDGNNPKSRKAKGRTILFTAP